MRLLGVQGLSESELPSSDPITLSSLFQQGFHTPVIPDHSGFVRLHKDAHSFCSNTPTLLSVQAIFQVAVFTSPGDSSRPVPNRGLFFVFLLHLALFHPHSAAAGSRVSIIHSLVLHVFTKLVLGVNWGAEDA